MGTNKCKYSYTPFSIRKTLILSVEAMKRVLLRVEPPCSQRDGNTTLTEATNDDERPPLPPMNHHTTPRENHPSPIANIKHTPHIKPLIGRSVATRYPNNPQRRQKNQPNTQKTRKNTPNKTPNTGGRSVTPQHGRMVRGVGFEPTED
jgi:hypothetical protein